MAKQPTSFVTWIVVVVLMLAIAGSFSSAFFAANRKTASPGRNVSPEDSSRFDTVELHFRAEKACREQLENRQHGRFYNRQIISQEETSSGITFLVGGLVKVENAAGEMVAHTYGARVWYRDGNYAVSDSKVWPR